METIATICNKSSVALILKVRTYRRTPSIFYYKKRVPKLSLSPGVQRPTPSPPSEINHALDTTERFRNESQTISFHDFWNFRNAQSRIERSDTFLK